MNIQDVKYIVAIAEAGSIGKAADKLLIAQPSLSKCIQKVEREYDITLFTRVKGVSVKLTPEGELFLGMAREMLLSHMRFQAQLRRIKELRKTIWSLA
jgi:DNA-binding transcriptional LysR family regulator